LGWENRKKNSWPFIDFKPGAGVSKLKQLFQIISNMGWRYFFFRAWFEIKKKSGLLKKSFPLSPPFYKAISLDEWKKTQAAFFFSNRNELSFPLIDKEKIKYEAESIINGNIRFFNSKDIFLGKEYDWVTNPDTGVRYDIKKHWSEINDYSKEAGDIKFVWEKSRFSFIYTLIRDEQHNKNNHAEFIFSEIESWIDHNPINCGPNYRCSQEISLRVLNWIFALYYYSNDSALSQERWEKMMNATYWQMHHVYHNINFSRIAVRNNHAVTETLALFIVGTLFPWMKDASVWKLKGKKWFEEEISYQIYEDGTHLQFSMNYHRVIIQLLSWAIRISELNKDQFVKTVYDRAYQSLHFLYQCQEPTNGYLPNYGANDGALFFPLNACDYRDYRPQLEALHQLLCGRPLYHSAGIWSEDANWIGYNGKSSFNYPYLEKKYGIIQFNKGGYYLIRDHKTFTFIRCGNHKDRPSQADNLHVDIWLDGKNILADAGSYKYNTDDETIKYFMGSESHNTVMLDHYDQMLKGARFIWFYWTQCISSNLTENAKAFIFEGSISSFTYLNKQNIHKRKVIKYKDKALWEIEDEIINHSKAVSMKQLWHIHPLINENSIEFNSVNGNGSLKQNVKNGWFSEKYGEKIASLTIELQTKGNSIRTQIKPKNFAE
jgi:hypothetical protein